MLADIALFEPNRRGRRAYDRFLAGRATRLETADRALAERMATAWFSLFRVVGRHEAAGVWLEDMLAEDRRLWLMDKAFETCATEDLVVGLRLFEAGPFHAGSGIIVQPDAGTVALCLLYGDRLWAEARPGPADLALLQILLDALVPGPNAHTGVAEPRVVPPRRAGSRRSSRQGGA